MANDFQQILTNLLNVDNDLRTKAEQIYDAISPSERLQHLFGTLVDGTKDEEVRQLSAVLLRRLIFSSFEDIIKNINQISFNQMKDQLLLFLKTNISNNLRRKVCDVVAEVSKNCIDDNGNNNWPEILQFMFESANSPDISIRHSALLIFASVPGIFGSEQSKYLSVIKQMLINYLCNDSDEEVKISAVKATSAFILAHDSEKAIIKQMSECILPMIHIISNCIDNESDDSTLKSFIDISEKCPQILRSQYEPLTELCLKTLSNTEKSDSWRHLALEIIITFAENAPSTVRKRGQPYLSHIVSQLLLMMTDLEEDPNWALSDTTEEEDDSESNSVIGESSLDRLSCSIGGKAILPLAINSISQMLQNTDWKYRFGALMAISAVGEGCHDQMISLLNQIVDAIIPYLADTHPRVRYAACNALGQMATDFCPIFENNYHSKVVPNLLILLDDYNNPRVQAHSGAALVNFFEECPQKIVINYLESVVNKIEVVLNAKIKELMERGTKLVLEQIVVTLASLADSAQENFHNYYDKFMPCLKFIIQNANTKELRLLRGKCIECVSLIGLAVGSDRFCTDACDIMNLLLQNQTGELKLEDDDPQLSYMITSWARICKILGNRFEPYLPYVMPSVLKAASIRIEVALLDQDDMKIVEEDNDWQCVNLGDQQTFGIKTAGLEEKATACQMLVCYARELKNGFATYVEDTLKIMVPMLKFYFHDGVRVAAAESLPFLIECAKVRGDQYVFEIWTFIYPELIKAIETEPEKEVLAELMTSLSKCIDKLGQNCLNEKQMQDLIRILENHLKEHFERYRLRQEKRNDEDYDDGVEAEIVDEDDEDTYVLSKVADILHSLFIVFRNDFYLYFDLIFQQIINLAADSRPYTDRQWAICVMDDVIEHGGEHCVKYQNFFLPLLSSGIQSPHAEIRQAAAYGIGVLAKHGGLSFARTSTECIPLLVQMINDPNARLAENITATENAISAVTKILQFNNSQVDVDNVLPVWLSWLPVWEDEEEIPHIYGFLYSLLEGNHSVIMGPSNSNLPHIVAAIAEVLARMSIDSKSDLGQKLISYLQFIKSDTNTFNNCYQRLTTEQQQSLNQVLL
ncbi:importin-5-like [Oppia nitens]|uniref:importin-5-like n=1 Tax=Oppia nitens TaxID=1686743 RepID=UPI0023DABA4A|nr:importin-5-like [Oppia nitens]